MDSLVTTVAVAKTASGTMRAVKSPGPMSSARKQSMEARSGTASGPVIGKALACTELPAIARPFGD
jgi:hypothetical protein